MKRLTIESGVESISPNDLVIPLFAGGVTLLIPASVCFMHQLRKHPGLGGTQ